MLKQLDDAKQLSFYYWNIISEKACLQKKLLVIFLYEDRLFLLPSLQLQFRFHVHFIAMLVFS